MALIYHINCLISRREAFTIWNYLLIFPCINVSSHEHRRSMRNGLPWSYSLVCSQCLECSSLVGIYLQAKFLEMELLGQKVVLIYRLYLSRVAITKYHRLHSPQKTPETCCWEARNTRYQQCWFLQRAIREGSVPSFSMACGWRPFPVSSHHLASACVHTSSFYKDTRCIRSGPTLPALWQPCLQRLSHVEVTRG